MTDSYAEAYHDAIARAERAEDRIAELVDVLEQIAEWAEELGDIECKITAALDAVKELKRG